MTVEYPTCGINFSFNVLSESIPQLKLTRTPIEWITSNG